MGSILLASPALREIKKFHPDAQITLLTLSVNEELANILPSVDKVVTFSLSNFPTFSKTYFRLIRSLRKQDYDLIVDLEFLTYFSAITTILLYAFTDTDAIGFRSPKTSARNLVYTDTSNFDDTRHISAVFLKLLSLVVPQTSNCSFAPEKHSLINSVDEKK